MWCACSNSLKQWTTATGITRLTGGYTLSRSPRAPLGSYLDRMSPFLVWHRDLKLDNTLLDDQKPPFLKICDFGFARHWATDSLYRTKSHLG